MTVGTRRHKHSDDEIRVAAGGGGDGIGPQVKDDVPDAGVVVAPGILGHAAPLRRRVSTDPLGGTAVAEPVAATLRRGSGGGEPLPEAMAGPMGEHFGYDLSALRVHADAAAGELTSAVQATAFTHGDDIYVTPSAYHPDSPGGQKLLAHEVSHVVAQRSGADRGSGGAGLTVGKADDPAEAAADRAAEGAMGSLRRAATAPDPPTDGQEASPDGLSIRRQLEAGGTAPIRRRIGSKKKKIDDTAKDDTNGTGVPAKPVAGHQGMSATATAAFKVATPLNNDYAEFQEMTEAWVSQDQQKKIADVGGATSTIKDQKKATEKRSLKDLLRASLMADFALIIEQKLVAPKTDADEFAQPTEAEQKKIDSHYLPRTLQNRDKMKGLIDKGPSAPETQTWLREEGFEAAIPRTDAERGVEGGGPRIDVRSTFIGGKILGAPRRMHLFIVYTSTDGDQFYFRGGPDDNDMTVADFGRYEGDTVDWDPSAPSTTIAKGEKAKMKFDGLLSAVNIIDAMQVPYVAATAKANTGGLGGLEAFVSGENCNSVAWTLLDRAGLPKKKPSGLFPGWGHQLGKLLKQGTGVVAPPEDDTNTRPAVLLGPDTDTVQIYADRTGTEKLIELPGGTPVNLVLGINDAAAKITFGAKSTPGWVHADEVGKPPKLLKQGRKSFWVAGRQGGFVPLIVKGKGDTYADCWSELEVLDDDFMVGGSGKGGLVKVRYTDKFVGTVEGKIKASDITDVNPKSAPPQKKDVGNDTGDKGKAPVQNVPVQKVPVQKVPVNDQPQPKGGGGKVAPQKGRLAPRITKEMIPLFEQDGSKHRFGGVNGGSGREVTPTGNTEVLVDGGVMVEFIVTDPSVRAWMPRNQWQRLFGEEYPAT